MGWWGGGGCWWGGVGGVSLGPEECLKVGVGVLQPSLCEAGGGGVVCEQRRRWEQFVPANDNVAEV